MTIFITTSHEKEPDDRLAGCRQASSVQQPELQGPSRTLRLLTFHRLFKDILNNANKQGLYFLSNASLPTRKSNIDLAAWM